MFRKPLKNSVKEAIYLIFYVYYMVTFSHIQVTSYTLYEEIFMSIHYRYSSNGNSLYLFMYKGGQ